MTRRVRPFISRVRAELIDGENKLHVVYVREHIGSQTTEVHPARSAPSGRVVSGRV